MPAPISHGRSSGALPVREWTAADEASYAENARSGTWELSLLFLLIAAAAAPAPPPPPIASTTVPPPIISIPSAPPPPRPPADWFERPTPAKPLTPLPALFSRDDYPVSATRQHQQGTVRVALTIDQGGRVSACHVEQSSRSAALDSATCSILRRRARFTPARDLAGKPVPSAARSTIRWALAPSEPIPVADWEVAVDIEANAAGEITSCREHRLETAPRQVLDCESPGMRRAIGGMVQAKLVDGPAPYRFRGEARMANGRTALQASNLGGKVLNRAVAHLRVAADGVLVGCDIVEHQGVGPTVPECRRMFAGPYAAARDAAGNSVVSDATVMWSLVQVGD